MSEQYYKEAAAEYKRSIASAPQDEALFFELGKLYYSHGDFEDAIAAFERSKDPRCDRYLAIANYRSGDFTRALEFFSKFDAGDDQALFYHALTCEKLNLFDEAVKIHRKIKDKDLAAMAALRIEAIERKSGCVNIKDIDRKIYDKICACPSQDKYPQAGAIMLYADEATEITPQNTQITSLHYIVKIINERGKEEFAETAVDYDSTYERIQLEYARTIKSDGSVVEVGTRHIRDVSKYLNFPLYSNVRAFIISFPEVAEGVFIEYKLKIYRSRLVNNKDFALVYPLQSQEPLVEAHLSISLPQGRKLHVRAVNQEYNDFNAQMSPVMTRGGDKDVYRWKFKDIPQIIPEANMPPFSHVNPSVLVSSFSSWQEVYDWWWGLAREKIACDAGLKAEVKRLVRGRKGQEEKARAIYNFCAQKIRYVAVEYGQAGHEPHSASDIYKNRYGDCKDQAILLVSMLREAGLKAYPVLISTRDYYDADKGFASSIFNHCIAALDLGPQVIFMDPTAETCPFKDLPRDDQGRQVMVFRDSGYSIDQTPRLDASHNSLLQTLRITVEGDETIKAKREIFTRGIYDQAQRYWLLYTQPELIQEKLKERIQEISIGSRLAGYRIDNLKDLNLPIILSYAFSGPEYFTAAGNLRIMPQLGRLDTSLIAKDKRRYPIDFGATQIRESIFEIALPDGFVIKYIPADVDKKTPWFSFSSGYRLRGSRVIQFRERTQVVKESIPQEDYQSFKSSFGEIAKGIKQRVVIEKESR